MAKVTAWLPSGHGVSPIRGWREGKQTAREKDEEGTQRTLVDRGRNKSFFLDVYLNMAQKRRRSLWDLRVGSNKVKM